MARREWTGRAFQPDDYLRIKGAALLPPPAQRVLRALAVVRDTLAKRLNRPPFKVISGDDLLTLALKQPTTPAELDALFPSASAPARREPMRWIEAIREGLADTSPLPQRTGTRLEPFSAAQERAFARLRVWRGNQAKEETVEPAMVFSTDQIKSIVRAWPRSLDALAAIPGIRRWQVARYGNTVLALLS
jgi:ribonuclease D